MCTGPATPLQPMLPATGLPCPDPVKVTHMEILLIDLGALGVFLGYVTIVYWHAVTHEVKPREPRLVGVSHATATRERTEPPLRPARLKGNVCPGAAAEV